MNFADAIKEFAQKVETKTTNVYINSCYTISEDIAEESPVSTGRLLGQWAPNKNTAGSFFYSGGQSAWKFGWKDDGIAEINKGAALASLLPRIAAVTNSLSKKEDYYFTNDTPYIQQAEHEGWQNTRAYHMRENAILNWQLIVNYEAMKL